jgi:hypothetical protein
MLITAHGLRGRSLTLLKAREFPVRRAASTSMKSIAMADDRALRRKELQAQFAELKAQALARLEIRGYDVRGKTPAQIRLIIKRRPSNRNRKAKTQD